MIKRVFNASLFIYCLFFLISDSFSQVKTRSYIFDPLLAPREHTVDFQHMKLEVSFESQLGLVKGKVTHYFIPLRQKTDSIVLDGINIDVKEIVVNGKAAQFRNNNENIIIYTPSLPWEQKDSMTITYQASPRNGLYFIGWNDKTGICRRQIW